jgi:hypothetical protein
MHKLFWIALRRFCSGWKKPLILVTPKTVVAWRSRLVCCIAFSSSGITDARFSASTSRGNPVPPWIVQQMREAWLYTPAHRFLLFDHDAKFGNDVMSTVTDWGIRPRLSFHHVTSCDQASIRAQSWKLRTRRSIRFPTLDHQAWPFLARTSQRDNPPRTHVPGSPHGFDERQGMDCEIRIGIIHPIGVANSTIIRTTRGQHSRSS